MSPIQLSLRSLEVIQTLLLGLTFSIGFAQPFAITRGWPPLQVFDVEQGLPQAFVSGVVEDDQGFIWISTLGGLTRYDGHQMRSFQHRAGVPTSPSAGGIISMKRAGGKHEATASMVWLFYDSGAIDLMNTTTGQCQSVPELAQALRNRPMPRHLLVDRQGNNQRERRKQIDANDTKQTIDSLPVLPPADVRWLEQLEQLTLERLGRFDLTADDLADELNMSRRTFTGPLND